MVRKTHSIETRAKQSASHKGKTFSATHRENISKSKIGENHPNWGKRLSAETIDKIRQSNKGQKRTTETRTKISTAHSGRSHTGLVDWNKVIRIRLLATSGKSRTEIKSYFPELSYATISDIVACRTWKHPPNKS